MKKTKISTRILSLLFAVIMICSAVAVTASATELGSAETPPPMARWSHIHRMNLTLSFDDGVGAAVGTAMRQTTASSIEGTVTVYKYVDDDWEYVDSWTDSTERMSLAISVEFDADSGATYKAYFEVTGYTGTASEVGTLEDIRVCP